MQRLIDCYIGLAVISVGVSVVLADWVSGIIMFVSLGLVLLLVADEIKELNNLQRLNNVVQNSYTRQESKRNQKNS